MSLTWPDAPVAETLTLALDALFPNNVARRRPEADKECLSLSYREDFEVLWNLSTEGESVVDWSLSGDQDSKRTIVIVWDGMPPAQESTINISDYVTPYDWALAFSRALLDRSNKNKGTTLHGQGPDDALPQLRILILDLKSQEHSGAFSHGAFPVVGHALPWVQVYRPVQPDRVELAALLTGDNDDYTISLLRSAIPPGLFGIEALLEDLRGPERILSLRSAYKERNRTADIEAIIGLWQSSLVRPGDRHHVGNLLAPMLLAEGLPVGLRAQVEKEIAEGYPLRSALKTLVGVIGLGGTQGAAGSNLPEQGVLSEMQLGGDNFDRRSNLRFLLVDDQYSLGYQHVLACLLFGDQYHSSGAETAGNHWRVKVEGLGELHCADRADHLLDALDKMTSDAVVWESPYHLDLFCDVLILDLRLWTNADGQRRFLNRLLDICGRLKAERINDAEFQSVYERAKVIASGDKHDSSEIESLVLFPLILSHRDPSLPIILFSSTHQRAVVELVSHRPNIITDFAKPILSGYGEERSPAELVGDLERAVRKAVHLHEARCIWERLPALQWKSPPVFEVYYPSLDGDFAVYNWPHSRESLQKGKRNRYLAGTEVPRINDDNLRMKLASQYVSYLERASYFDFASVPWELLEGSLIPERILNDPSGGDPGFSLDQELDKRNYLARFLEIVRHKKAHGHALSPRSDDEVEQYRLATILQFLFLLDFLGSASVESSSPLGPSLEQAWSYLRIRHKHLFQRKKIFDPRGLIDDESVGWLDFLVYASRWAADKAVEGDERFLSAQTAACVRRLLQRLLDTFWQPIEAAADIEDEMPGLVVDTLPGGMLVQVAGKFFARLPENKSRPSRRPLDPCIVIIVGSQRGTGDVFVREKRP
jgi:hypothetical protein